MRRFVLWAAIAALAVPQFAEAVCTKCVATQITAANANKYLFGGSDAAGGIDDWYLTNKKVEVIIDDIGTNDVDVVGGTQPITKTSSNAVATGGTLVDVGLYKQNNDQLPQSFNVGGLSLAQVLLFRQGDETVWGATSNPCTSIGTANAECPAGPECASITVYGLMLMPNVSTQASPTLHARTRYEVCDGEQQLRMRTEIWNQSGGSISALPINDVFLWGGRGLDAFVPAAGRGFNHIELDLSNATNIAQATQSNYWFAPGNLNKKDGKMARGKQAKEVSYGHIFGLSNAPGAQDDSDGPGPNAPITLTTSRLQLGLHGNLLSGAIPVTAVLSAPVPNGASRVSNRALIVGKRNDGNSVTGDPKNPSNIFGQFGYPIGTQPGAVSPGSSEEGTITFIRVGGSPLNPSIPNNSPVTMIRAKGGFKVYLPEGDYQALAVFPGRNDILTPQFTVNVGNNPSLTIDASNEPKLGTLKGTVVNANGNAPMPAKISLKPVSPSVSPGFRRDFQAMNFSFNPGMCSNNFNTSCTADADCGGGNTCFRTCTNKQPATCTTNGDCDTGNGEVCASDNRCRSNACTTDGDCDAGALCKGDTESIVPESFPGGAAQLNVIYTADGKINQKVRPGTYEITVSRGIEYSIQQLGSVTVNAGGTVQLNGGAPITLNKVVDTTGWVSADFHIHSGRSLDSSAPLEARVRSFAAEGVDVMVSTDHDIVTDYNPAIAKLKLGSQIGSIVGTEVTTSVGTPPYFSNAWGHINGWPQLFDPNQRRSNSVEDENGSANVIHDRIRASLAATANKQCIGGSNGGRGCTGASDCKGGGSCVDVGTPVLQLNHVRAGVSGVVNIGFFDNIGYNPATPITACAKYPTICPTSQCFNGTNDGTACTTSATCTGGGVCGCASASVPSMANGCNSILLDLNVIPQASVCSTAGCGSGFEIASGTRNIDADVMEVDNGGNASGWPSTKQMRRDWLSLVNQNVTVGAVGNRHPMWATGVSDSHRLIAELPGYSRTFVQAGDLPDPAINLDIKTFNQKVIGGKMFASTGPFLEVTADTGGPVANLGDTLDGSGGIVNLNIEVQAAPWVPVDEVRVIKNGCVLACFNGSTSPAVSAQPAANSQTNTGVVRFNATIVDSVSADSYYVVEASPNLPVSGRPDIDPVVDSVAAGAFPLAYSNPIFADFDGGGYGGIGTSEPSCGPLPPSCSAGAAVASAAPVTMIAKAPVEEEMSLMDRILSAFLPAKVQAHEAEERPEDEAERLEQHEKTIRKQGGEYFPRQFVVLNFPTPKPEEAKPADDDQK